MKLTVNNSQYVDKFNKRTPTIINNKELNKIQKFFFYQKNSTITSTFYLLFFILFFGIFTIITKFHPMNDYEFITFNILFTINIFIASVFFHQKVFISTLHRYHTNTHKYQTLFFTDKPKENIENSYIMNYKTFIDYTLISYDLNLLMHTRGEPFFDDLKRTLSPTDKEIISILEKPSIMEIKDYIKSLKKRGNEVIFYKPFSFENFNFSEKKEILFFLEEVEKKNIFVQKVMHSLNEKEITKRLSKYISFDEWKRKQW